jgi:signal transduction histidine kinase
MGANDDLVYEAEIKRLEAELAASRQALRESERNLERAQHLGTFGVLACGLVHDFNNLLTIIAGMTSLALEKAGDAPVTASLKSIRLATQRASELARHLLHAASTATPRRSAVCLNEVLEEVRLLIRAAVPAPAVFSFDFAENLPAVNADVTQVRQVVLNLVLNAAEALDGSGTVSARTGVQCAGADGETGGNWIYLEVTDSGRGMGEETHARIFEPFFSKKRKGGGLGLGVVKQIVAAHGGMIQIESVKGEGTTVRILLPYPSRFVEANTQDDATRKGWDVPEAL